MVKYLLLFYVAVGIITLIFYGVDKYKAQKGAWRIPESVLLSLSFFGGAIGGFLGMQLFRHKTRHWYFWAVNILSFLIQLVLLYYLSV